jgi:hypothetical protein
VSIICPLGKINDFSNCQSWTIALHGGLLINIIQVQGWFFFDMKMCMLRAFLSIILRYISRAQNETRQNDKEKRTKNNEERLKKEDNFEAELFQY